MDKISKIASIAIGFALLWVFSACTDDLLMEGQGANGVDMNRIVEVDIPFNLGKGITSQIVTRVGETDQQGKDSQLSGVMVFVYKNTGTASKDSLVAFQFFESPLTSLEGSTGGWIPEQDDATCGHFKLHLPLGSLYIYLIGNAQGSFIDFFPEIGESKLVNREEFLEKVTPKWNGNMFTVDGFLPLAGSVNNSTGACTIKVDESDSGKGIITYKKENDSKEYTISQRIEGEQNEDNSFVLKRLMCKVSMEFKSGSKGTFTPISYKFRHCGEYVPPAKDAWSGQDNLNTIDTKTVTFDAQTPNSFTVYLPENIREYTGEKKLTFADRDRVKKGADGKNLYENNPSQEGHEEHYQFENAPDKSTYVEIIGKFEGGNISADTKYILHLGDFSSNKFNEFSLRRDYHYQYTVTVNGVNDIVVEVKGTDAHKTPNEINPAVEGVVFEGGARVQLDAHYEQVEMKLVKNEISDGVYIYAQTPFGIVNCKYKPAKEGEGMFDESHSNIPSTKDQAKKLLQWIEFKKQSSKGTLASYGGNGDRMDVFAALDKVAKDGADGGDYYTCFVDEYYYTTNPVDNSSIGLSDFINAEDRTFSLGSDIQYSKDGQSAVASAVYVLQQHSIACFYDLNNTSVAKYGVELTDEIGDLAKTPLKYNATNEGTDPKDGRSNTQTEIGSNIIAVNWAKNGFLLNDNGQLEPSKERLESNHQSAHLACLTRNRDFNGNGRIDEEELRWYTPARDQMLGLWIGEPALPAKAALYPGTTEGIVRPGDNSQSIYPIFTSTNGDNRVIWAEEGCTFGSDYAAQDGGYVRAVRNIGNIPSTDSHTKVAGAYYEYNSTERTIEVFLTDNALRSFSYRELAPHHERSVINRPYKKFQVAKHPYVKTETASCGGHGLVGSATREYSQLQTTSVTEAKEAAATIVSQYPGDGETSISNAVWRLPNQRELALMVVAMPNYMDYNMDDEKYHYANYGCSGGLFNHNWGYSGAKYEVLHCRTSFSSKSWTQYGFMYNTKSKQMQMLWMKTPGDGNQDLGQGTNGIGGCICVRDVAE